MTGIKDGDVVLISEEQRIEGDQLVALWNQFKADPNKVKNKDLGELHKVAMKLSGHASSAILNEIAEGTRKTRAWRKKYIGIKAEAKGNSKKVSAVLMNEAAASGALQCHRQ